MLERHRTVCRLQSQHALAATPKLCFGEITHLLYLSKHLSKGEGDLSLCMTLVYLKILHTCEFSKRCNLHLNCRNHLNSLLDYW